MANFTFRALVKAPIDVVFDVLTDHRGYSRITPVRSSTLEREGKGDPNGLGAIRRLGLVGPPIREEVTEFARPNRFVYRLLSGAPVRDHVGTVELAEEPGGTRMTYDVRTTPTLPWPLSPAVVLVMRFAVNGLFQGVVKRSEELARAAG
jgi:hypothetical protein